MSAELYRCPPAGRKLGSAADAVELIGAAAGSGAGWIVIPAERLRDEFFDLKTRVAGEFLQKFAQYGARVAFVGDTAARVGASQAWRAFVAECDRGASVRFAASEAEMEERLQRRHD